METIVDTLEAVVDTAVALIPEEAGLTMEGLDSAILDTAFRTDNLWILLAAGLVFIMHLGFATLEAGLTRSKNTVNILFKNTMIIAIGLLTYFLCGFNLMYPGDFNGYFGFAGFGIAPGEGGMTRDYADYTYWADFIFQGMFAATAATIISGAVAERIKEFSFLIFATLYVAICYPIVGSWQWGGGFLSSLGGEDGGFYDFAGSTLVHSVGGWGALMAVVFLGARLGKYVNGKVRPIPGHSMPLVMIGVMLLWLGWFGFNGGSVLSADPELVSLVFVTTGLAAAAGIIGAAIVGYAFTKTNDLTMALNGCLAGLVSITAGADLMSPSEAILIGFLGGMLVVAAVIFFDKIKIDDPVGAISVHLVCGIWGTLAVGIFGAKAGGQQLMWQLIGVGSAAVFCVIFSTVTLLIIKSTLGLRVSKEVELEGLDSSEHGMSAYPNFLVSPADGMNS
jgi:Amt family ammonium transporter